MTIDEMIDYVERQKRCNDIFPCSGMECSKCENDVTNEKTSELLAQLPELLKELKELRSMVKSTAFKDGYIQGRADVIEETLKRVWNRLLTYSVGDNVVIDFNLLSDEFKEIAAELNEKQNDM